MDNLYTTRKVDDRTGCGMAVDIGEQQVFLAQHPMELALWISGFEAARKALEGNAHG